jgi:hypothetical protein
MKKRDKREKVERGKVKKWEIKNVKIPGRPKVSRPIRLSIRCVIPLENAKPTSFPLFSSVAMGVKRRCSLERLPMKERKKWKHFL